MMTAVYTGYNRSSSTAQGIALVIVLLVLIFFIFLVCLSLMSSRNKKSTNEQERLQELRDYKKLLDEGIITQEDYEEKKKQLLNL